MNPRSFLEGRSLKPPSKRGTFQAWMTGSLWAQAEGKCRDGKGTVQFLVESWGIFAFFSLASWAWGRGGRLDLFEVCTRCQSTASGYIQRRALMFAHLMSNTPKMLLSLRLGHQDSSPELRRDLVSPGLPCLS